MSRTAKGGLSRHPTKGFRIKLGKTGGGTYRTFWLGHDAAVANYYSDTLRGQFENMKADGRDVWTENYDGGFAFAVFHPDTALPQKSWAIDCPAMPLPRCYTVTRKKRAEQLPLLLSQSGRH